MTKIAVIQFPGSNCERETMLAVKRAGMEPIEFLWNEPHERLRDFDGYIIVGGFSYEDRSRAGILASLDPIMPMLREESERGKPILGICNGAQILVETGLVPGVRDNTLAMALAVNVRMNGGALLGTGFYNGWTNIQLAAPSESNAFSLHMAPGEFMRIPVAHGEGRFLMTDGLLAELARKNLTAFRYCDESGKIREDFPVNPNGALYNLAAVTNASGNIMAIMPHPERSTEGDRIFSSMRKYIEERRYAPASPLDFVPAPHTIQQYKAPKNSAELHVALFITDNEAISVQNTLQHLGISANVRRQTHWVITFEGENPPKSFHASRTPSTFHGVPSPEIHSQAQRDESAILEAIKKSGELYNSNKEKVIAPEPKARSISFLVRYKDDFVGQAKKSALTDHLGIQGIADLRKGVLWNISAENGTIEDVGSKIVETHILFNPFSQECYRYSSG